MFLMKANDVYMLKKISLIANIFVIKRKRKILKYFMIKWDGN